MLNNEELKMKTQELIGIVNDEYLSFGELKLSFDEYINTLIVSAKKSLSNVETEEDFEKIIVYILNEVITDEIIDNAIRLPKTLEWADNILIKKCKPILINFIVSFIIRNLFEKYGGNDWFGNFKKHINYLDLN